MKKLEPLTLKEFMKTDIPKVEYVVDEIIPKGELSAFFGPPGTSKSTLALYLALRGAQGLQVLNFGVKRKFRTIYIDEENGPSGMKTKLEELINGLEPDGDYQDNILLSIETGFRFIHPSEIVRLNELTHEFKPDLIIVDSLCTTFPLDENKVGDVKKLITDLKHFLKQGIAILLIHHSRKKTYGQITLELEDMAGSRHFGATISSVVCIDEFSRGKYKLHQAKRRYGMKIAPINYSMEGVEGEYIKIKYDGLASDCSKEAEKRKEEAIYSAIVKWMDENAIIDFQTCDVKAEMNTLGFKKTNIESALNQLQRDGRIEKKQRGVYARLFKNEG